MLAAIGAIALALAVGGTPSPLAPWLARLPNGSIVFKPTGWLSVRDEDPRMLSNLVTQIGDRPGFKIVDVFVDPDLLDEWRDLGKPHGRLGTNQLIVSECNLALSASATQRANDLDVIAKSWLDEAKASRRKAELAGQTPKDLIFGPSVRDERIVTVMRNKYNWRSGSGYYLLSSLLFWHDGNCLVLMLNGEGDSPDAVRTLARMTELIADKTQALVPASTP